MKLHCHYQVYNDSHQQMLLYHFLTASLLVPCCWLILRRILKFCHICNECYSGYLKWFNKLLSNNNFFFPKSELLEYFFPVVICVLALFSRRWKLLVCENTKYLVFCHGGHGTNHKGNPTSRVLAIHCTKTQAGNQAREVQAQPRNLPQTIRHSPFAWISTHERPITGTKEEEEAGLEPIPAIPQQYSQHSHSRKQRAPHLGI